MNFGRVVLLAASLALGFTASVVAPSGCILNDYCIVVTTPGTNWCVLIEDALMWPVGQPDLAEPGVRPGWWTATGMPVLQRRRCSDPPG